MDLVLGLSMTATAVRWVLVEGTTGEGAPIDHGTLDMAGRGPLDAATLVAGLPESVTQRVHAVGVTWTRQAEAAADPVLAALAGHGLENVIVVSEVEATEVLAQGIADITGNGRVAVCAVEPGVALVAVVDGGEVTVERIDRPVDGSDVAALSHELRAMVDATAFEAVFVLGSGYLDPIVSSLSAATTTPVITAAEADFALARGAALTSALAVNILDAEPARRRRLSTTGALACVLGGAVITFVVSGSIALGLQLAPSSDKPDVTNVAEQVAPAASPPSPAQAAPPPASEAPAPPAAPAVAETIALAPPPPPEAAPVPAADDPPQGPPPVYSEPLAPAPAYVPPAAPPPVPAYVPPAPAYQPPAPAYVPPPPPAYAPPAQPKPRLRDRIIEKIPIINRFHEPQYPTG